MLKVQDDVQLAIAKFGLSIKACWFQASFNDSTKRSWTENISQMAKIFKLL